MFQCYSTGQSNPSFAPLNNAPNCANSTFTEFKKKKMSVKALRYPKGLLLKLYLLLNEEQDSNTEARDGPKKIRTHKR